MVNNVVNDEIINFSFILGMYVMVAGQLRSSVKITECSPSIRVLKIAALTNNVHSEALWFTEVIHAQLKKCVPWTLFKFTYKLIFDPFLCISTYTGREKGLWTSHETLPNPIIWLDSVIELTQNFSLPYPLRRLLPKLLPVEQQKVHKASSSRFKQGVAVNK